MRILVYGAGNIGSLYAARLAQSSHDVSILARGKRLDQIRTRGIELEDYVSGERSATPVQAVDRLNVDDAYDLILVVLPKNRIAEVLPTLAANTQSPTVMFFCNNAAGSALLTEALGPQRVVLGFPGAAAIAQGSLIRYVVTTAREQPTTIGELDGRTSPRLTQIASALKTAGFPVSICSNMDAWLKTHVAKILPSVGALFHAGGTLEKLASDDDALRLMVRGIREGFRVLRANHIPITPANHRVFELLPEAFLVLVMRKMLRAETAAIKFGHAQQGQAEWQLLSREFRSLIERVEVATPSIDALDRHLKPSSSDRLPPLALDPRATP